MGCSLDSSLKLTKSPSGSLREVVSLSVPIMLVLLSGCLLGFVERILLAKYSREAMEGSISALYLCRLFQLPCMGIALFGQVFVATYVGSKQLHRIGECIWQMIWFSLLSILITFPISWVVAPLFFEGTVIEHIGVPYFYMMAGVNFLFPLGCALSSFYLGQGKTKLVVLITFSVHILNIILDRVLIFGVGNWIFPLGVRGAAFATAISQGVFCLSLFALFMQKSHRDLYGTRNWAFNPIQCWRVVRVGLPRALGRIIILGVGTATIHVMTSKGGYYLLSLSIGASISIFLSFLGDGLYQAMLTLVSHQIGSNQLHLRWKLLQSSFLFAVVLGTLLTIPLLIFPEFFFRFFFDEPIVGSMHHLLYHTSRWVWFHTLSYISHSIFLGFIFSLQDTFFHLTVVFFTWATSFLPVYYAMNYWHWSPDKFWVLTGMEAFIFSIAYFFRLRHPKWNSFTPQFLPKEVTE